MPVYGISPRIRNISKIKICVDGVKDTEPMGRLISPYRKEAIAFTDIISMVTLADHFFSQMGFPQAYNRDRSFAPEEKPVGTPAQNVTEVIAYMDDETFEAKLGEKFTFVIAVQFRQNSSWQGTITWVEQKKVQRFRSTLEMIKLMDSALAMSNGDSFTGWE